VILATQSAASVMIRITTIIVTFVNKSSQNAWITVKIMPVTFAVKL